MHVWGGRSSERGGGSARPLALVVLAALVGCERGPSDDELDRMLEEVRAAEQQAAELHGRSDERASWELEVRSATHAPVIIGWGELSRLATTHVRTAQPAEAGDPRVIDYRGVRVDALVERVSPADDVSEVTFLAYDGFRATALLADVRRYPITLAIEADGEPITRDLGGPIYLVHPHTDHPELVRRYDGQSWVFYVTHVMVGTEPPSLRVGARTFDRAALEAMEQVSLTTHVGYRLGWPSEAVRVEGVRLRDLLAAAGLSVPSSGHVRVLSHAPISHGDARPTRVRASDVASEDVIVALRYGEAREPIPARLGGPLTLAFSEAVAAHLAEHDWLTFVEALEVEP